MLDIQKKNIVLFGAGGHAKVAIDALEKQGRYKIIGLYDDNSLLKGQKAFGYPIFGLRDDLIRHKSSFDAVIITIGNNEIRRNLSEFFVKESIKLATIVHPSVQLSRGVRINIGTVVFASTIINADSVIGESSIINTAVCIDHDCKIGDYVHIAPGVTICGGVSIGDNSFIGAGSTIIAGLTIGKNVIVGAGSTVIRDLPDGVKVAGCPAVSLKNKKASE